MDVFADEYTTKLPGSLYSRDWNPTALGIDGFARSWTPGIRQKAPLLYVYPPFQFLGRVLRKVIDDRQDCLLILPGWPQGWRALLFSLPIRARWLLPHVPELCIPGPMVSNAAKHRPLAP